jgi:hypothetical protein
MTQAALLEQLEQDLAEQLKRVRAHLAALPEDALLSRPEIGRWNAAECFAHLNAVSDYYLPRIELAIHKAKARHWHPDVPLKSNALGRRSLRRARPEMRKEKPRKAAKSLDPLKKLPMRGHSVKSFLINTEMLLRLVRQAKEVDLNKAKVKPIRWSLSSFRLCDLLPYLYLHAQRHILQAEEAVAR